VLKIDLLPKHFAIARTNKRLLFVAAILLVVVVAVFFLKHNAIQGQIAKTEETLSEVKPIADNVRKMEAEISEKQGWLDPIRGKIDFITKADESGGKFFERFHAINKYIWQGAQMSSFSITGSSGGAAGGMGGMSGSGMMGQRTAQPTGGTASTVQFTVEVRGTAGVGRFLLNLLRCPDLTSISYSGVPGGQSIEASGAGGAATTGAGAPGMGMGGPGAMPPGMAGPGMMGPGGMPPATSGAAGAGVEPGSPNEPITLQITATLTEPITVPTPPTQAVAGVGMGGGMGAGMMGPGGMAPPGAMGPAGAGGPPGSSDIGPRPAGPGAGSSPEGSK